MFDSEGVCWGCVGVGVGGRPLDRAGSANVGSVFAEGGAAGPGFGEDEEVKRRAGNLGSRDQIYTVETN